MSKIVISGYYGFANAGDEAMLAAIIESLRQEEQSVQLTVISGHPEVTAAKHQVLSVHRFNFYKIIQAIRSSDLLISGGGSLLQDVTSKKSLLYYLLIIFLGRLLGKKTMLYAQGIGPIRSCWLRRLTSVICNHVDAITVRDQDSLLELQRLGVQEKKVELTADAVFSLLPESTDWGSQLLQSLKVPSHQPLVGIAVRQWECNGDYFRELAKAADILVEAGIHIVLIPLQQPTDVEACQRLYTLMQHQQKVTIIRESLDTRKYLSLMGNLRCLVGMRLHALIFAAVMHVPFVALSYDPKIDGFIKEVRGTTLGRIEQVQASQIVATVQQLLSKKIHDFQALEELHVKAKENTRKVIALIKKP